MFQDNDLSKIPSMKNKDAVNNFLKTASKLTSIEENSEMSSGSEPTMRPIPTPRQRQRWERELRGSEGWPVKPIFTMMAQKVDILLLS